jgi:hypothetical protein
MSNAAQREVRSLSLFERINELCLAFEAQWRRGSEPRLSDFVPPDWSCHERGELLKELIAVDLHFRQWGPGQTPLDYYLPQFPDMQEAVRAVIAERPGSASGVEAENPSQRVGVGVETVAYPAPHPAFIGRYRVLGELGRGGFAVVYRGQDDWMDRPVAIKVSRPSNLETLGGMDAYCREAKALARLDHPHIVTVYDVGRGPAGSCYIVSQYIEGSDLGQRPSGPRTIRATNEALTGRRSFRAESRNELLALIANRNVTPPRSRDGSIPEALDRVATRALALRLEDRYRSARALAEDLQSVFLRRTDFQSVFGDGVPLRPTKRDGVQLRPTGRRRIENPSYAKRRSATPSYEKRWSATPSYFPYCQESSRSSRRRAGAEVEFCFLLQQAQPAAHGGRDDLQALGDLVVAVALHLEDHRLKQFFIREGVEKLLKALVQFNHQVRCWSGVSYPGKSLHLCGVLHASQSGFPLRHAPATLGCFFPGHEVIDLPLRDRDQHFPQTLPILQVGKMVAPGRL